jgi:phosphate-selective porin OprO and OprP
VLHVGTSARFRDLDNSADNSEVRYRQRPFFHFTNTRSVDTGDLQDANSDGGDADSLWGGYLSASYFLTDAQRDYDPKSGTFGRVKVRNPVQEAGIGAWEVAARYDYIALNDGSADIRGGKQGSTIVGINWYLNDDIRLILNGAWTHVYDANPRDTAGQAAVRGSSNDIFGVGARTQVDF